MNAGGTATRTSFQNVHLRFVDAFRDARTLDRREYLELLDIIATIVARLHAADLDHEERPS